MTKEEYFLSFSHKIKNPHIFEEFQREVTALTSLATLQDAFSLIEERSVQFGFKLNTALDKNELINQELARHLFFLVRSLLHVCKKNSTQDHVPYSLAAINYFFNVHDASNDFLDHDGFKDDELVLKTVVSIFSLDDALQKAAQDLTTMTS